MKAQTKSGMQTKREDSKVLIGEMMLAKTVLEEKNELLDEKDRIIRELLSRQKLLEKELSEFRGETERMEGERAEAEARAEQEGMRRVITDVVHLAGQYKAGFQALDRSLSARLIRLLRRRYSLEVIAEAPDRIDPERHQVIEAEEGTDQQGESEITVLSWGYRLGGKTIKPALLRVVKRARGEEPAPGGPVTQTGPWRVA